MEARRGARDCLERHGLTRNTGGARTGRQPFHTGGLKMFRFAIILAVITYTALEILAAASAVAPIVAILGGR